MVTTHTFIFQASDKCKSPADVWVCLRIPMDQRKQILGLTEGTLLEGGLRRVTPDCSCTFWTLSSAAQRHRGLLTGALPAAQCFRFLLGCADIHVCEETLMLDTIFWIFSSFFRMLDLTAQILSCWSLINCSSSASSDFKGSTTLSVILRYRQRNGLTQKNKTTHKQLDISIMKNTGIPKLADPTNKKKIK